MIRMTAEALYDNQSVDHKKDPDNNTGIFAKTFE